MESPNVDHQAERAAAVEARRRAMRALEEARRQQVESHDLANSLKSARVANRFAERIAEAFRQ